MDYMNEKKSLWNCVPPKPSWAQLKENITCTDFIKLSLNMIFETKENLVK